MADEPENDDTDLSTDFETEDPEIESPEGEAPEGEEDEDEEYTIELDGEDDEPEEEKTPLVRDLRGQLREAQKKLKTYETVSAPKIEVGEEPTLEGCDYDEDAFKEQWRNWNQRKFEADNQEQETTRRAEVQAQEYQKKLSNYTTKLAQLPIAPEQKQAAQDLVVSTLPPLLQSAIVTYADDPAKVVVALAKHPKKLEALAQEGDPIRFILAMRDIERNLKVVTRKKAPAPESVTRSTAAISASSNKTLEKLEKEAERTGDRSKLIAYRASTRAA